MPHHQNQINLCLLFPARCIIKIYHHHIPISKIKKTNRRLRAKKAATSMAFHVHDKNATKTSALVDSTSDVVFLPWHSAVSSHGRLATLVLVILPILLSLCLLIHLSSSSNPVPLSRSARKKHHKITGVIA